MTQCDYPQLTDQHTTMIALREEMEKAALAGDYPAAVDAMDRLETLITSLEEALAELDAKRQEYLDRLPALTERLDGARQSDFKELVEDRLAIEKGRAAMEAAATASDFPTAVDHMDSLTEQLDALDERIGALIEMKKLYEAALASLQEGLGKVERCDYPELATKKAEIIKLRDQMLALALETDFGGALALATGLQLLVPVFVELIKLRDDYVRRHDLLKPRLEAMRAFTYKSLDKKKAAIETLYTAMTGEAAKAAFKTALEKMAKLETLLKDIEAANEQTKLDEAGYKVKHDMLKPKVDVAAKNKAKEAETEAKAVAKAYKAMTGLAEKHEFAKALEAGDKVAEAIAAYEKALDGIGDAEEKYKALKAMVAARLKRAGESAKDFKSLKGKLGDLQGDLDEADELAGGDDFEGALKKLTELGEKLTAFEGEVLKLAKAKSDYEATAKPLIERFKALPKEAKEKADDAYDRAKDHMAKMEAAAKKDEFDEATDFAAKLKGALDEIDDALKGGDELKAEYEGRRDSLKAGLEKVAKSKWPEALKTEKSAVETAVAKMEEAAGRDDYRAALDHADTLDTALKTFDAAEDKLEQKEVQFKERMDGFKDRFQKAKAIKTFDAGLLVRAAKLQSLWDAAEAEAKAGKFDSALAKAAALRSEVDAILEALQAQREEEAEEDDGILDKLDDAKDWVIDEATDYVKDYIKGVPGTVVDIVENGSDFIDNAGDAIDHALDGEWSEAGRELLDAGKNAVEVLEGVDELRPGPGIKTVKKGARKVVDKVSEVVDAYDTGKEIYDKGKEVYDSVTGKGDE